MSRSLRDLLTVSPPTLDRMPFSWADRQLRAAHAPYDRAWLMERFEEGLQIRMLPPPAPGIVLFQPGRLSWRPIEGLESALVVHDLRVEPGPAARKAAGRLWAGVYDFATFYGFSSVLAVLGDHDGLISPDFAPGRGWMTFDHGPGGARLTGRVLHGPIALPRFPRDWSARAAALGPGAVIQTMTESQETEQRAERLCALAARHGVQVRRDLLTTPHISRARAVSPAATFAAVFDGKLIGGSDSDDATLLRGFGVQSPS